MMMMTTQSHSNNTNASEDIFFPVALRDAAFIGIDGVTYPSPGYKAVVREHPDRMEPITLGIVKDGYELLPNRPLFEGFENTMRKLWSNAAAEVSTERAYMGARVGRRYRFRNKQRSIVGDPVAFNVYARNSYDGSTRFRVGWSVETLVCMNQLTVQTDSEVFVRRHTKGLTIDGVLDKLATFASAYDTTVKQLNTTCDCRVTEARALNLLGAFPGGTTHWQDKMIEHALKGTAWPIPLWNFINTVTYWASNGDVRRTREDNTHAVRWNRQEKVRRWLNTPEMQALVKV